VFIRVHLPANFVLIFMYKIIDNGEKMKVKICGIKTQRDLSVAINAGADAIGSLPMYLLNRPERSHLHRHPD